MRNEKEVHLLDTGYYMWHWPLTSRKTLTLDVSRSNFELSVSQELFVWLMWVGVSDIDRSNFRRRHAVDMSSYHMITKHEMCIFYGMCICLCIHSLYYEEGVVVTSLLQWNVSYIYDVYFIDLNRVQMSVGSSRPSFPKPWRWCIKTDASTTHPHETLTNPSRLKNSFIHPLNPMNNRLGLPGSIQDTVKQWTV